MFPASNSSSNKPATSPPKTPASSTTSTPKSSTTNPHLNHTFKKVTGLACLVYGTNENHIQTVAGKGKISLIFFMGAQLDDPHSLLEGDGSKVRTTFHTQEIFSGLLLPLFGRNLHDLTENFQGFVAALKAEAEK